jgi:hypothetical protein
VTGSAVSHVGYGLIAASFRAPPAAYNTQIAIEWEKMYYEVGLFRISRHSLESLRISVDSPVTGDGLPAACDAVFPPHMGYKIPEFEPAHETNVFSLSPEVT